MKYRRTCISFIHTLKSDVAAKLLAIDSQPVRNSISQHRTRTSRDTETIDLDFFVKPSLFGFAEAGPDEYTSFGTFHVFRIITFHRRKRIMRSVMYFTF